MTLSIYSTRRGLLSATLSSLLLSVLGLAAVLTEGPGPIAVALLIFGFGLLMVTAFDYPRRSRFGEDGICRICFFRRHLITWDAVNALERARSGMRRRRRMGGDSASPRSSAGLVARVGKRRYMLVNTLESRGEFDALAALVADFAPHVHLSAEPPGETRSPTDLYRKKRGAA